MLDNISVENITLQDCIDMYEKRNQAVVLNDGEVVAFEVA